MSQNKINTVKKGTEFELKVFAIIEKLLNTGSFLYIPNNSRIFHQKQYYSEQRKSDITVDISIEVYLPDATAYSQLCIIECKNYTNPVPVDDIEEFKAKLDQIAGKNIKGIFCSSSSFQMGVFHYAQSNHIGLCRLLPDEQIKWDIYRQFYTPLTWDTVLKLKDNVAIALTEQDYIGHSNFLFTFANNEYFYNFAEFFTNFLSFNILTHISNAELYPHDEATKKHSIVIPFLKEENIEQIANEFFKTATGKAVTLVSDEYLSAIKEYITQKYGFQFVEAEIETYTEYEKPILGKICFNTQKIEIYSHKNFSKESVRFTIAHEIGHVVLHGGYFLSEADKEHVDYENYENYENYECYSQSLDVTSLFSKRIEIQANLFASSLLMPKKLIDTFLSSLLDKYNLKYKGYAFISVDYQQCNIQNYYNITDDLMRIFKVSRRAITIRLQNLGYLKMEMWKTL